VRIFQKRILEDVYVGIFVYPGEVGMIGAPGKDPFLPGETDGEGGEFVDGVGAGEEALEGEPGGFTLTGDESLVEVLAEAQG